MIGAPNESQRTEAELIDPLVTRVDAAMHVAIERFVARAPEPDHPWLSAIYAAIYDYPRNGGKRMHALAQLLAFRTAGGADDEILPIAAGFQLYHHHTLVHDDVYDEDVERRGSPTIHAALGRWLAACGQAGSTDSRLFAGSLQRRAALGAFAHGKIIHALAFETICAAPFPAARLLPFLRAMAEHDVWDSAGQMKDLFHEGAEHTDADAIAIAELKTARLFATGVHGAAVLAGAQGARAEALTAWIRCVATAYQLMDDLADLDAESEKGKGRGVGSDIAYAKPTFLVATALRLAGRREAAELRTSLAEPEQPGAIARALGVIAASGAVGVCRTRIDELIEEGLAALCRARPVFDEEHVDELARMSRYFLSPRYWNRALPAARDPLAGASR